MKYLDEFRDAELAAQLLTRLRESVTRPWTIMEICGGQTHSILKYGIDRLLPEALTLVHGPGCPVCVTPLAVLDQAHAIATRPEVIFCSFGDMLRVPGSAGDLLTLKAAGADIRVVYSPLDALQLARENPRREIVFLAIGFETTAPANAMLVYQARQQRLTNLTVLVSQVLVPPAMRSILAASDNPVQGFLAAGHVCVVMGLADYVSLAECFSVPMVVSGFEPVDILQGLLMCVRQLEEGRAEVENQYDRTVRRDGNPAARDLINRVFRVVSRSWRGLGSIADSGLALRSEYASFDALARFGIDIESAEEGGDCISGQIMLGRRTPPQCPAFATRCRPEHPLGAPMVSHEGACAAYYRYHAAAEGR